MVKTKNHLRVVAVVFCLLSFLTPAVVAAEKITSFSSDIEIQADGTLHVTETIVYDFESASRHGIFRDLETGHAQDGSVWHKDRIVSYELDSVLRNGSPEPVEIIESGDVQYKIGDPAKTISGEHEYRIAYKINGAISTLTDGTHELYWNVTGNSWPVTIERFDARVSTADGASLVAQSACYRGERGSIDRCQVSSAGDQVIFSDTTIYPNQQVTIGQAIDLSVEPEIIEQSQILGWLFLGTIILFFLALRIFAKFAKVVAVIAGSILTAVVVTQVMVLSNGLSDQFVWYTAIITAAVLIYAVVWYQWLAKFRVTRTKVVQYEPYEDVLPMYSGVLLDRRLDSRDVTAGFLHLAQQGFIKIHEVEKNLIFGFTRKDYQVTLLRPVTEAASLFHTSLLSLLFSVDTRQNLLRLIQKNTSFQLTKVTESDGQYVSVGTTISLNELKKNVTQKKLNSKILSSLRLALQKDLVKNGFVEPSAIFSNMPNKRVIAVVILAALVLVSIDFLLMFAGIFALAPFLYPRRTEKGHEAKLHLEGFKEYLSVTGRRRFAFHNAPSKNPQEFLEYLPYAIAFGVEKEWAKVFDGIEIGSPDWYQSSNHVNFNAASFSTSMTALGSSFASSGASGGSSGGGRSGGGGGGGGGGSW